MAKNAKNRKNTPVESDEVQDSAAGVSIGEQISRQKQKEERRKIEEELRVLLLKKESTKMRLIRVQGALEASPENAENKHFLHLQQKLLETAYADYNYFQNQLYEISIPDEVRCEEEMKFIEFEALYSRIFVKLTTLLEVAVKAEAAPVANQQGCLPYVPPLKAPLPTFDGNYENWFAFKNMFENVMGRYQHESPAIKLYHLRNALIGSAAGVIDQDIINNNDYQAAWDTLRERYEDNQVIIDKHIDAIFNLPSMNKDSAVGLRKIIDTCSKNVDGLKNLQLPVDGLGEMMLLNVLSKKMDLETRKAWELNKGHEDLQDYDSTMEFLKERCRVYEKISRCSKTTAEAVKSVRTTGKAESRVQSLVATSGKCSHCKSDHELWKCEQFKKASLSDNYLPLRKSGSCFNCLEKGHVTSRCSSEHSCKVCSSRHHTYLHKDHSLKETHSLKPTSAAKKEVPESLAESTTTSSQSTEGNVGGTVLCTSVKT
ncbi:uncharacterized protein LOC134210267 [Armigeres subalbatus]|uniref:uncharacterized protein LOC134210267 n=1 Tax=Armigeres subalbatus TaxID=124917 RepID=UPI002ED61AF3